MKKIDDFEIICPASGMRTHPPQPLAYGPISYMYVKARKSETNVRKDARTNERTEQRRYASPTTSMYMYFYLVHVNVKPSKHCLPVNP